MPIVPLIDDNHSTPPLSLIHSAGVVPQRLPVLATASDIREFVQYLRLRPNGVVAAEELDRPKKRLFEERKLAAYERLGLTTSDGVFVKLSSKGWYFARNFESDAQVFRLLLRQMLPCWSALQWLSDQKLDIITAPELLSFWQKSHPEVVVNSDEEQIKGVVVSFFSFCQGAVLGTMTLGKRGHITRFCVDRTELTGFLEDAPTLIEEELLATKLVPIHTVTKPAQFRVVIQGQYSPLVETLQRSLELVDIASEHICGIESLVSCALQLKNHAREHCALVVVIGDDAFTVDAGMTALDDRVLLGLGAAHVLFNERLIVLAEKRITGLGSLRELNYYEFAGAQLSWDLGLEIVRVLGALRDRSQEIL